MIDQLTRTLARPPDVSRKINPGEKIHGQSAGQRKSTLEPPVLAERKTLPPTSLEFRSSSQHPAP
jgi:hypothetical protein